MAFPYQTRDSRGTFEQSYLESAFDPDNADAFPLDVHSVEAYTTGPGTALMHSANHDQTFDLPGCAPYGLSVMSSQMKAPDPAYGGAGSVPAPFSPNCFPVERAISTHYLDISAGGPWPQGSRPADYSGEYQDLNQSFLYTQTPPEILISTFTCDQQYLGPFFHGSYQVYPMGMQQPASGYGDCGIIGELPHLRETQRDCAMPAHVEVRHASVRETSEPSEEWVNRLVLRNATKFALQKAPEPADPKVNGPKPRRKKAMIGKRGTNCDRCKNKHIECTGGMDYDSCCVKCGTAGETCTWLSKRKYRSRYGKAIDQRVFVPNE